MENFTTPGTNSSEIDPYSWDLELQIFEGFAIFHIAIGTYILLSLLVYGTKTDRWRKKAYRSSLNNGPTYVGCFVAVGMTVVRLIITETLFALPRLQNGSPLCNLMCDLANVSYAASTWTCYAYLWFLQRIIYNHPCVKSVMQSWVNLVSKVYIVPHALICTGLIIRSVYINSFVASENGCVLKQSPQSTAIGTNAIISSVIVLSQSVIFALSMYPLLRNNFNARGMSEDDDSNSSTTKPSKVKIFAKLGCACGQYKLTPSPIERSTYRASASGGLMVLCNILSLTLPFAVFPTDAPVALRQTLYDVSSVINIFCIVSTLGRTVSIFTALMPRSVVFRREVKSCPEYDVPLGDINADTPH